LLATDLTNLATPLIRYRVADLGQVSDEPAACGRGLTTLRSIEGRSVDVIEAGNGRRVTLFAFVVLLRHFPQVRAWQVWQGKAGDIQLLVQGMKAEDEAEMRTRLGTSVPGLAFDIIPVDSIPATPAGKRPYFVKHRTYTGQKEIGPE
jgi:phenylacetate-CoA ligase